MQGKARMKHRGHRGYRGTEKPHDIDHERKKIRVLIAKPGSTATTAAPRSSPARQVWRSSIPDCVRRRDDRLRNRAGDVDVIGLSILSGAHNTICPELMRLLRARNDRHRRARRWHHPGRYSRLGSGHRGHFAGRFHAGHRRVRAQPRSAGRLTCNPSKESLTEVVY